MIKLSKTGAAAILVAAVMMAPASATEQARENVAEPVRTASAAAPAMDIAHRKKPSDEPIQRQSDSNGWGMLAAGLCVGLLIIARRRRG